MRTCALVVMVMLAGCKAAVDLERPRAYPCTRDGGDAQCRGGWVCGFEGVCVDPAVSEARRCQRDDDCGRWHCGPRDDAGLGDCYDVTVPAPVACTWSGTSRVSADCAAGWLCGFDGRCVAVAAGVERQCDESLPCGAGYACSGLGAQTNERQCVPFAAEAPVDAGAFSAPTLFSPRVHVAARHNAVTFGSTTSLAVVTADGGLWVATSARADGGTGLMRAREVALTGVREVSRFDSATFVALTPGALQWVDAVSGGVMSQTPLPVTDGMLVDGVTADERVWVLSPPNAWVVQADAGLAALPAMPGTPRLAHVMVLSGKTELVIVTAQGLSVLRNGQWVPLAIESAVGVVPSAGCDAGSSATMIPPSAIFTLLDNSLWIDEPGRSPSIWTLGDTTGCLLDAPGRGMLCEADTVPRVAFSVECDARDGGGDAGPSRIAYSQHSHVGQGPSVAWVVRDGLAEFGASGAGTRWLAGTSQALLNNSPVQNITPFGAVNGDQNYCQGIKGSDERVVTAQDSTGSNHLMTLAIFGLQDGFGLRLDSSDGLGECSTVTATTTIEGRDGKSRSVLAAGDRLWAVATAADGLVRLAPVPFGRITSITGVAAADPLLLEGWLIDSGRLFHFTAANEVQWSARELPLDPGFVVPPRGVWQAEGRFRVTMDDGTTFSLPGFVSLSDAAPRTLFEVEGYCGTAWGLATDGLYRLDGRTWTPVPVPATLRRPAPMAFAGGALHRSSSELFVSDTAGNVAIINCATQP
ncbi:MAG: hypothetical protein U0228_36570 [Myxococcaceae bacterium]